MKPYGIMFHHFHGNNHPVGQGSISASDLNHLIDHVGQERIIPAKAWLDKALTGNLMDGEICLTFDDALLCQYEIAEPVLRERGLTAFWFVYTSIFEGAQDNIEIYRYFRTNNFENLEDFYRKFNEIAMELFRSEMTSRLENFNPDNHLKDFPFYTTEDRLFRYIRDDVLGTSNYHRVMNVLMDKVGFEQIGIKHRLWMTPSHIRILSQEENVIGLHSHNHPTRICELSADDQRNEYSTNQDILREILGKEAVTMSHPCNSYNSETLEILKSLNIKIGFRANMVRAAGMSALEFPREDHSNIMKEIIK